MSMLRFETSISLDGFVAGKRQSKENPLGIGGSKLHEWAVALAAWRDAHGLEGGETNASTRVAEESDENIGAIIMGRNMFGGGSGPWGDDPWTRWWGDEPPFHLPVFVLTHHARSPLVMRGGTTFTFVTDGVEVALERARAAAGGMDVALAGGANVAQQYLAAGFVDEMEIHLVPVLVREGARLFDHLPPGSVSLEQVRAVEAPGVTHLKYKIVRG